MSLKSGKNIEGFVSGVYAVTEVTAGNIVPIDGKLSAAYMIENRINMRFIWLTTGYIEMVFRWVKSH